MTVVPNQSEISVDSPGLLESCAVNMLPVKNASGQLRIKFFLTGAVLPGICLVVSGSNPGMSTTDTPWQSGRVADFVAMLFQWPSFGPFLPAVLFSAICLTVWCMRQDLDCRLELPGVEADGMVGEPRANGCQDRWQPSIGHL